MNRKATALSVVSVATLSFCVLALYFSQYALLSKSIATASTASLSMLAIFLCAAFASMFLPVKTRDFAVILWILLLARYVIFRDAWSNQTVVTNILMGAIFGASALGTGSIVIFKTYRRTQLVVIAGFAGACVLSLAFKLFTTLEYGIIQEICLVATTLLLSISALLGVDTDTISPSSEHNANSRSWESPTKRRKDATALMPKRLSEKHLFSATCAALLLFCFGMFEEHGSKINLLPIESSETTFTMLCVTLAMFYITWRKKGIELGRFVERFSTAAFAVCLCICLSVLVIETLPPAFFVIMNAGSLMIHCFIWLYCAHMSLVRKTAPTLLFGTVLSAALIIHRLGWLLAELLATTQASGATALKAAAVVLAVMAATMMFITLIGQRKRASQTHEPKDANGSDAPASEPTTPDSTTSAAADEICTGQPPAAATPANLDATATATKALGMPGELTAFHQFCDKSALTEREREILLMYCRGRSIPRISEELFISENTVKTHIRHIYNKTGIANKQLIIDAIDQFVQTT